MTEQKYYCGRFGHTGPSSAHYGKYDNNMGKQNTQLNHESQMQGCKCAQTREGGWNHVLEGDVEAWDGGEKWGPAIVNARS